MPQHSSKQIFQTLNARRWRSFKWGSRFLIFCLVFAVAVIFIAMKTEFTPQLPMEAVAKKALQDRKNFIEKTKKLPKEYEGFQKFINTRWAKGKGCGQRDSVKVASLNTWQSSAGIRSAFYVAWDAQSYFSLKRNISKLNLVLPEWFFLDPSADTIRTEIDKRALDLVKASGVKIIPMLTNNIKEQWRGDIVHRIITNKAKRERLINDLIKLLKQNGFSGINIDFEELVETRNEVLSGFQKELYQKLHANNLLVTQDVSPFNEDYDYKSLSDNNDYLFLMAYDEHSADTKPGSISSQKWMEAAVGQMSKVVPANKIILGMAGYGYDWPEKGTSDSAVTVTYQEALSNARESQAAVDFDNDTYNLHYSYYDDNDKLHEVFFTDAGTNFNTLRFATEYGLAGTALWRLGSEDNRLWDFYDKDMSKHALASFDFNEFDKVESSNDVDYIGEGEILDVVSKPQSGHITPEIDTAEMLISEERYDTLPSMFVVKKWGKPTGKQMVLTFDDGPDPEYTRQVLDTLAKYHVPASFFVVGIEAESNIPLVKREFTEGHELGNHTFSHPNMAEISTQRALLEMDATRLLIECITGHTTIMFRAPFNADSEPEKMEELIPVALSRTRNYLTVGESIDPEDWQPGVTADSIFNRVVRYQDAGNIILLHDAGGDRSQTVEALPRIIQYFRNKGYTFTTVANLLGKKRDDVMPTVPTGAGYAKVQFYLVILEGAYYVGHIMFSLFVLFLILGVVRLIFMAILALKQHKKEQLVVYVSSPRKPLVSIIVPAYNEEVNAVKSLQNLLRCDYENFNIIFVDDGSKDSTYQKVDAAFANHNKVKIFSKPNGGKASALNFGIAQTDADYVVCIDADTQLRPDAVRLLMKHFLETDQGRQGKVAAVAGNVKVGNEVNMITRWQSIEYITSQNFDRTAFANINAITVVPGAIGAFKKDVVEEAGGFTTDTLAEDCDLTIRILKLGYLIENENGAIAMTEAPETIKQFLKQRFRWSFGVMQTFWKHRDALFNTGYKSLGWAALPNILLFQFIIPVFSPLADLLMIVGLFTENAGKIGKYYLLFMIVDTAIALLAFTFEKEKLHKLLWLIPQRLGYRWLMYIVLFRAFRRAIKGELQNWGVLKRTGNVKDIAANGTMKPV
jgi:cellulose synthase/poly-beta-1,6-N-acetylglucosamine synthase-like glycosyltransferase/spore germination protein YaaH/peptidoglycan/xylan/chitin deacetylase (PgdA/CDA1 family)